MDVSVDNVDATDAIDDLRLLLLLVMAVVEVVANVLAMLPAILVNAIFCHAAGSIICYGLFGYSKIFLLISGDCRCRCGMTSLSEAIGQIS